MQNIIIYTKVGCPYCTSAKQLLSRKGVTFTEIDISREPSKRPEMISRARGRTTVPQIFIGDRHVGGCDDLYDLEYESRLDDLLASPVQK